MCVSENIVSRSMSSEITLAQRSITSNTISEYASRYRDHGSREPGVFRPSRVGGGAPPTGPRLRPQLHPVRLEQDVPVSAEQLREGTAAVRMLLRVQRKRWRRM